MKNLTLKFDSQTGLIPVIIQDANTLKVLMLGYMNQEAYTKTLQSKLVTFYSRSRKQLWTKGETSGHWLKLVEIKTDCDQDTLLIKALPQGPVCHLGTDTCWGEENNKNLLFLNHLESIISDRKSNFTPESYTARLFKKGLNKIAQKVGEEAVELVIEAKDQNDDLFLNEAADLLFHYLILLQEKNYKLKDVIEILTLRNQKN